MFFCLNKGPRLSVGSAALGAFLFAFGSSRVVQIEHAQLLPHFFAPLALLSLFHIFRAGNASSSAPWIALFYLSLVGQLYAGFYLGWFTGLSLGACFLVGLARRDTRELILRVLQGPG